jgi:hypothetical protein
MIVRKLFSPLVALAEIDEEIAIYMKVTGPTIITICMTKTWKMGHKCIILEAYLKRN